MSIKHWAPCLPASWRLLLFLFFKEGDSHFISPVTCLQLNINERPACTPKPGPIGGSVKEAKPPAGSQEKCPLLGPGLGIFASLEFISNLFSVLRCHILIVAVIYLNHWSVYTGP